MNASNVPQTPPGNTANVIEKTFFSLTFQWNGANSTSSNASSVYLMSLKTSWERSSKGEERVLGLVSDIVINFFVTMVKLSRCSAFDLLKESPW